MALISHTQTLGAAPTHDASEASLDQFNRALRAAPWYQAFFAQRGLNPSRVQLSKSQRQELAALASQNGVPVSDRMTFDAAGNLNQSGGFAGQPKWAKAVEIAAPIVASAFIPGGQAAWGSLGHILGVGGSGGAGGFLGVGGGVGASAGASAGTAATHAVAGSLASMLIPKGIDLATGLYGQHVQNTSNQRAMDLEAQANRDTLEFLKAQDAANRLDKKTTDDRNYQLYQDDLALQQRLRDERDARLQPYRAFGVGSLGQIGRAIPGVGVQPGSLGARMGA